MEIVVESLQVFVGFKIHNHGFSRHIFPLNRFDFPFKAVFSKHQPSFLQNLSSASQGYLNLQGHV